MKILKRKIQSVRPLKILQFGGGNFLRGYLNWMVDVLNRETDFNGDVIIVKPTEQGDYKKLKEQDGLYHVRTNGIKDGKLISEVDLIECVQKIVHPYQKWESYLKTAHNPDVRFIVSNTTESGIQFNESDKKSHKPPNEFPAKLTLWLYERWKHFEGVEDKACIILPFELIEDNGTKLKECILEYSELWELGHEFTKWIEVYNIFCDTLVDRIVTGYPKNNIEEIYKAIGYEDKLIVDAEPYHLLVIRGPESIKSELPFAQTNLNVVFTDHIEHYREIKVRILNGAHTAMVPIGYLSGFETVGEVMKDPELSKFLNKLLIDNVIPTLDFPEDELMKYLQDVLDRFRNPFIHHKLIDISLNSISKFKTRLLPSLLEYHRIKESYPRQILTAFAALILFYNGRRKEEIIPLRDSNEVLNFCKQAWQVNNDWTYEKMIEDFLSNEKFWGQNLNNLAGLSEELMETFAHHDSINSKFILHAFNRDPDDGKWEFSDN